MCHYISLYIIIYHYISLYIIIYHYISLYIIIYYNISLHTLTTKMDIKVNTVSKSVMLISIFISRRSSSPHGNHIHQYQHAGDAEDEFTHLCDLIDFAAEMNFKLDDINKHSFNEFQLRCCFFFTKFCHQLSVLQITTKHSFNEFQLRCFIYNSVISIIIHHQALKPI